MNFFAGPFIGEFGWELCYWHGWLRKIKKNYLKNEKLIVSSFPGRQPLYEFADEFISLPQFYLDKNFTQRGYFIDLDREYEKKEYKIQFQKLLKYYTTLYKGENILQINNFPQKKYTRNLFLRTLKKVEKNFFTKSIASDEDLNSYLKYCNHHPGINIPNPLFLNYPKIDNKYIPQTPTNDDQLWTSLKPTNDGKKYREQFLENYDRNKNIFTLFPRKRNDRRPDKNWSKDNWMQFIDLLIKEYDCLIVICGTREGAYFHELENNSNILNLINVQKDLHLDLQLAFIDISKIAIHGRSGSCNLSMQNGCPTFMAGPEHDRYRICVYDNPMNSKINYYTEYGVNPSPKSFFNEFKKYFNHLYGN